MAFEIVRRGQMDVSQKFVLTHKVKDNNSWSFTCFQKSEPSGGTWRRPPSGTFTQEFDYCLLLHLFFMPRLLLRMFYVVNVYFMDMVCFFLFVKCFYV